MRQLEAIIRISESLARMQLLPVASVEHVTEAVRLFQVSTLHAAQTGGVMGEGMAGSNMLDQLKRAEQRIERRLPIGSSVAIKKLVEVRMNHLLFLFCFVVLLCFLCFFFLFFFLLACSFSVLTYVLKFSLPLV